MGSETNDAFYEKVKNLDELLWEHRATRPAVDRWLANFVGDCLPEDTERRHALYLLTKFLYFGRTEIRELLRAMFQDLVRHPLSTKIRAQLPDKNNFDEVHEGFLNELNSTRFLGLGNPAESGTRILYDFRQVNELPVAIFIDPDDLYTVGAKTQQAEWTCPNVHRLIFIDDFCGTGSQAVREGGKCLPPIREAAERSGICLEVWYLTLLATSSGLEKIRESQLFNRVESVSELDTTYRIFDVGSQVYTNAPNDLKKCEATALVRYYGEMLLPASPLGYGNCQLLIGFEHNIPNNTLPIMWCERSNIPWRAMFQRFAKY